MTRVKLCGLSREADVRHAVEFGAWACGFVLSDGPRRVTAARAHELGLAAQAAARDASTPTPLTVAVVTTEPAAAIAVALTEAGCDAVQLAAGADGVSVAEVRAAAARRGLRPLVIAAADTPDSVDADLILLDGRLPGRYGGTGRTADWEAAARLAAERPLVLAGGLTPATVAAAVHAVRPFAVDVSSGIESAPGVKDAAAMRAFCAAVAATDARPAAADARPATGGPNDGPPTAAGPADDDKEAPT